MVLTLLLYNSSAFVGTTVCLIAIRRSVSTLVRKRAQQTWVQFVGQRWSKSRLDRLIRKADAGTDSGRGRTYDFLRKLAAGMRRTSEDTRTWRPLACYPFINIKLASYHLLLYVVYLCQK